MTFHTITPSCLKARSFECFQKLIYAVTLEYPMDIQIMKLIKNIKFDSYRWFDEWLYINDKESRPADFQPKIITPAFVRQAILSGLENGWDIQKKSGLFRLKYTNGNFEVINL